jgi:uncharacterized repeat protein (TIGR03803 family)
MMKRALVWLCALFATAASAANAPIVLSSFGVNLNGGSDLYAGLVLDAAGNLYGTAESGGAHGSGVVFRLSPQAGGAWSETVLYSFLGGVEDGKTPHASLIWDGQSHLYGTTISGGIGLQSCSGGCGVVFQLTQTTGGHFTETAIYRFTGGADGGVPFAGLTLDGAGNLYGTTTGGGTAGLGVVFKLSYSPADGWTESVLHSFTGNGDGASPFSAPVFDAHGNLFGVTYSGGTYNLGTVYRLSPQAGGPWTEHVLYSFRGGLDGSNPSASLVTDQAGNVYGTTVLGGEANVGTAFELVRNGGWTKTLMHSFLGLEAQDGANPNGMIFDARGNLWGTTVAGGLFNPGTIFELSPQGGGVWKETVAYSFTGGTDGAYPSAGLTMDSFGNLYGTTLWGGPAGTTVGGVAFEFVP